MWVNPTQYKLVPTADSMSFMDFDRNTTGLPIGNHVGAYNVKRKFDTHMGVDLYVQDMDDVYSVADGVVIDIFFFTGENVGSYWWNDTMAILVEHNDIRVLYGEVDSVVQIDQRVVAGQKIGQIVQVLKKDKGRPMKMLHLEAFKDGKHIDPTPFLMNIGDVAESG